MRESLRTPLHALAAAAFAVGCFNPAGPTGPDAPAVPVDRDLHAAVAAALAGRTDDALRYAALYAVLADRTEEKQYADTAAPRRGGRADGEEPSPCRDCWRAWSTTGSARC